MHDEPVEQTVARIEEVVRDFRTFLLSVDAFAAKSIPRSALPYTQDHIQKALELYVRIHHRMGSLTAEEIGGVRGAHLILATVLNDSEARLVNTFSSVQELLGGPGANRLLLDLPAFRDVPVLVERLNAARAEAIGAFAAILDELGLSE